MFGFKKKKVTPIQSPSLATLYQEAKDLSAQLENPRPRVDRSTVLTQGHARLSEFTRKVNASLSAQVGPGQELKAHLIFPEDIWTNPTLDNFLFDDMRTTPFDPWNTILLPKDVMSSAILNLPVCPEIKSHDDLLKAHVIVCDMQRYLTASTEAVDTARDNTHKFLYFHAMRMAAEKFGQEAVLKSRGMFHHDGDVLRKILSA